MQFRQFHTQKVGRKISSVRDTKMTCRSASSLKAMDQARIKMEELTREGIVSFTFILSEEGPELFGEEELTEKLMDIFEERQLIQLAQRVKMRGLGLTHQSTRNMKIVKIQEAFQCELPPTLLPLEEIQDYDLIRTSFNKMMKVEGMGNLWRPGQDPPQKVQD